MDNIDDIFMSISIHYLQNYSSLIIVHYSSKKIYIDL
jgi:hypothetical protein